ncbi:hypothetical protein CVT24_003403 [Panaeolus cyanescens]|uniref:GATA-type domain-containing protein n=1 Tax=Panaeolus cyanescens TaxID=181874 RepID=A0A409Y780_9AGAR|nr:hypothetical protein CVT24_003403 [Panaeolus cyanescens]
MSTVANLPGASLTPFLKPADSSSFDFSKRKRWQDLLIAELDNAYPLILSREGKIAYCTPVLATRLGWKSSELLNLDFGSLLDSEDQTYFQAAFNETILEDHDSFEIVVRLKSGKEQGLISEKNLSLKLKCSAIQNYGPFEQSTSNQSGGAGLGETRSSCEFALLIAMPFFSKNTETLHPVVDLNAQIIRHVERIAELRNYLPPDTLSKLLNPGSGSQTASMYATSSLHTDSLESGSAFKVTQALSNVASASGHAWKPLDAPSIQLPTVLSGSFGDLHFGEEDMDVDKMPFSYEPTHPASFNLDNDSVTQSEEGSKKKKLKRTQAGVDLHVCITCGRTDSPEWRKGPQGPKTLCNACGLRWAKQVRKKKDKATSSPHDPPQSQSA